MPYAAVDVDGVLADVRHRLPHLQHRPKDWDAFFAAAPDDPLLPEGEAVARRLAEDHRIVYLTGRPERCRRDTEAWLQQHGLPEGRLVMRRQGDRRPARVTKVELLRRLIQEAPVDVLVDDDVEVLEAARTAGFAVLPADWMPRALDEQLTLADAQQTEGRT
ncbi:phosphatase domain-containing protein [Motilibacter rhizosphaerae]|uniref:phosphatase domain-containing protein n=1 Tax=Motilibacter rhizosphaerae TaxID=598652 RepID=UPI00102B42B1